MKEGTRIAYIPTHAEGNLNHKDVEFGFVTSTHPDGKAHFCRYWRKGSIGKMRTIANSELTPDDCLVEHVIFHEGCIDDTLAMIQKENEYFSRTKESG